MHPSAFILKVFLGDVPVSERLWFSFCCLNVLQAAKTRLTHFTGLRAERRG